MSKNEMLKLRETRNRQKVKVLPRNNAAQPLRRIDVQYVEVHHTMHGHVPEVQLQKLKLLRAHHSKLLKKEDFNWESQLLAFNNLADNIPNDEAEKLSSSSSSSSCLLPENIKI